MDIILGISERINHKDHKEHKEEGKVQGRSGWCVLRLSVPFFNSQM